MDRHIRRNNVVHQHMDATKGNVEILRRFHIAPIVVLRDLKECMLSMHNHIEHNHAEWPYFVYPPDFRNQPPEARMDFLIDFALPGIIRFKASWLNAADRLPLLLIDYRDIKRDESGTLRRILRHLDASPRLLESDSLSLLKNKDVRFNNGQYTLQGLSDDQQVRIDQMWSYYHALESR